MTPPSTLGDLLKPILERVSQATPGNYTLTEAYSYRPCGYHEKDWAVSWNGRHRFVERVPKEFADEIVSELRFAISSRPDIERLISVVEVMSETLEACLDNSARIRAEQEIFGIKAICAQSLAQAESILRGEG